MIQLFQCSIKVVCSPECSSIRAMGHVSESHLMHVLDKLGVSVSTWGGVYTTERPLVDVFSPRDYHVP